MQIKLIQQLPKQDGYYLMRFRGNRTHLVLIITESDGARYLIPDAPRNNVRIILSESHASIFTDAHFSQEPIEPIIV